ncbi:MAG TPA: DHA2 family efflux MFS transporter permease subunit [Novosphingobium sp.]|nr:DHA2 family efflux MFS transporter permease subunit [Novosphingobium sp.]
MAGAVSASGEIVLGPTQRNLAAFTLAISNFIVVLDMTVTNVSIPHIAGSLGVSLDQGSWVITSYAVAEALMVPLTGWLALRFGPVRMYFLCMAGFALFSLLCAASLTLEMIVAARIGQGMFGGLLMPLSQALMLLIFPMEQRAKAMMLASMTAMLGPALGPNVGGIISDNLSWPWIFLLNLPIVGLCMAANAYVLRGVRPETRKVPIDAVGLALMITWIGCIQLILDLGRQRDWFADPLIVALGIVGVISFVAFLIWELTEEHPIVDLRIFGQRSFAFGTVAMSMCFGGYFASIVVIPQWLQTYMGYPAASAGMIVAGTSIAMFATIGLAARLVNRVDPRLLVSFAIGWMGCMALVRSGWNNDVTTWNLITPALLQGLGMSFFMMPLMVISMGQIAAKDVASATGLQSFVRTLSSAIGAALALTAWGNAQQQAQAEVVDKLQAGETVAQLSESGFSIEQALGLIQRIVEKEAAVMALDQLFIYTAAIFFFGAAVIWLAPKPKLALKG